VRSFLRKKITAFSPIEFDQRLQHYLTMMGATVALPFLLCPALCMEDADPARGYIISTIFFTCGIVTLLQTTFGCR
jgi:nucleobase transporter 1/2